MLELIILIGVIVNTVAVILGSLIGLVCRRGIPKRVSDAAMLGMGLVSVYIGFSGALKGQNAIVLVFSIILGGVVGTLLDIDGGINKLGVFVERKFKNDNGKTSVAQGFVTASLLFCVGSMTIVGSLNAGISGDNEMLFIKSAMDFMSSMMLSASLGIGVICSAAFVFVFQGALVLLAGLIAPFMTEAAIAEVICAGSLLIIGIGLNLLQITKLKVADYLPAIVFAPVFVWVISVVPFLSKLF